MEELLVPLGKSAGQAPAGEKAPQPPAPANLALALGWCTPPPGEFRRSRDSEEKQDGQDGRQKAGPPLGPLGEASAGRSGRRMTHLALFPQNNMEETDEDCSRKDSGEVTGGLLLRKFLENYKTSARTMPGMRTVGGCGSSPTASFSQDPRAKASGSGPGASVRRCSPKAGSGRAAWP